MLIGNTPLGAKSVKCADVAAAPAAPADVAADALADAPPPPPNQQEEDSGEDTLMYAELLALANGERTIEFPQVSIQEVVAGSLALQLRFRLGL